MAEKRQRKRVPSTADAVAADLPDDTFVYINDDTADLRRVKKSTPNGVIFECFHGWMPEREAFRYRHSIAEIEIVSEPTLRRHIFKKYRDNPNLSDRMFDSEPPSERSLLTFKRIWGMERLVAYLLQARGFHVEGEGSDTLKVEDIKHFPSVVTNPEDRTRLASEAKHPMVRAAFAHAQAATVS